MWGACDTFQALPCSAGHGQVLRIRGRHSRRSHLGKGRGGRRLAGRGLGGRRGAGGLGLGGRRGLGARRGFGGLGLGLGGLGPGGRRGAGGLGLGRRTPEGFGLGGRGRGWANPVGRTVSTGSRGCGWQACALSACCLFLPMARQADCTACVRTVCRLMSSTR